MEKRVRTTPVNQPERMQAPKKKQKKTSNGKFKRLINNNFYVLLAGLVSAVISVVISICYSIWPFGDISILRMDLYHQYAPFFAELYDRITSLDSLVYSWSTGGGGLFLGNLFNYLSSPLSLLVLLFGHKNVPIFVGFLIFLKNALAACSMTYYLKESSQFKFHNPVSSGFGVLYSFSAWFVAYYWNIMWLDGMIWLPLIILGLERIVDEKKPWLYLISLAFIMVSSYYMSFMIAIFCVLYFLIYFSGNHSLADTEKPLTPNPKTGKPSFFDKLVQNSFLRSFLRCVCFALLAGLLAAFALLPLYFSLQTSSATSDTFPESASTYFNIFDFLANHFASLEPTIRSSTDMVLPNVYCGIITIMLTVLYFYVPSVPLKTKVSRLILIAVMYASFNVNYLNFIWHGFHFPNDLPYRQSFCYIFLLITMAATTMKHIGELKKKDILTISIITVVFLVIVEEIGSFNVSVGTILISIFFIVLYTVCLALVNNPQYKRQSIAAMLLCCMFAEVTISDVNHFAIDQPVSNYAGTYEEFTEVKEFIDEREDLEDYRMELTQYNRLTDPAWYGYNGISTFSSMAYEKSANLQYNLGMKSNYVNSYTYHLQTPVYNAMFALKYIVNNDPANITMNETYFTKIGNTGNMDIYENNYSLPLAYAVSQDITDWNYYSSNPFTVQSDYFARATGVQNVMSNIPMESITYYNINEFAEAADSGSYTFYKQNEDEDGSFTVSFTVPETKNIYLYLRSTDVDTINVYSNDGAYDVTQSVSEEYILDMGVQEAGTTFHIDIPVTDESGNVEVFAASLDDEKFAEGYAVLNDAGAMQISEMTDTYLKGTVTINAGEILYTSINYDAGWEIYIDGEPVSEDSVVKIGEALIGVTVPEGTHEIEFKYHAAGLTEGIIISCVTLAGVIAYAYFKKNKGKLLSVKPSKKQKTKS